jgi:ketosteroid isomerase-like protein
MPYITVSDRTRRLARRSLPYAERTSSCVPYWRERNWLTALASRAVAGAALLLSACGGDAADGDDRAALPPTAFRDAVEARDLDALVATFADDIRLYSPVLPDPFVGRERVARLFAVLIDVFQDIRISDEFQAQGVYVLAFDARVDGEEVFVVDLLRFDDTGKIAEFVVTMRPLPGIHALAAAVAPHLPDING